MTLVLVAILTLSVAYWFALGRRFAQCAPTSDDLTRTMLGDSIISTPTHSAMDAITIEASPDDIWPWLVQLGYQRGGLYSYDWLDRLFGFLDRPSATRVLPEFQHLAVGDTVSLGPRGELMVAALEPLRALVFRYNAHGFEWVWQFGLYPLDQDRTRLVTRGQERFQKNLGTWLFMQVTKPAAYIMTRRMLLGLKERAERRRRERERLGSAGQAVASNRSSVGSGHARPS